MSVSLLDGLSRDLAFGITDGALIAVVSATDSGRILARVNEIDVTVGVSDMLWWDDLSRARRQAAQAAAEAGARNLPSMRFAELGERIVRISRPGSLDGIRGGTLAPASGSEGR
ncbi:hypothetical protein ACETU7_24250 [Rhodococcus sp. 3Y1]